MDPSALAPMLRWSTLLCLLSVVPYSAYRLRSQAGQASARPNCIGLIITAGTLPLHAPVTAGIPKLPWIAAALIFACRTWDLAHDRIDDRALWRNFASFLLWFCVPLSLRSGHGQKVGEGWHTGRTRLGIAMAKGALVGGLILVNSEALHANDWLSSHYSMWLLYLVMTGLGDGLRALVMFTGHTVGPMFRKPWQSTSPRDFWRRRWNLWITDFAYRSVFLPCGGIRRPKLLVLYTFLLSGVMHEYVLFVGSAGVRSYAVGQTLGFFLLQGLAVVGHGIWRRAGHRCPPVLAWVLHYLWITATAPIFMVPFDAVFRISSLGR